MTTDTRDTESIASDLTAARAKLAQLKTDGERYAREAAEIKERRVQLLASGKREEAAKLREPGALAQDEADACALLASRETERIRDLEREHKAALETETRAKLEEAEAVVSEAEQALTSALSAVARAAARHRDARSTRNVHARSLGQPVASFDATAWTVFGRLILEGVVNSADISLDRSALLRFVQPDEARERKATHEAAMAQHFAESQPAFLSGQIAEVEAKLAEVSHKLKVAPDAAFLRERKAKLVAERDRLVALRDKAVAALNPESVEVEADEPVTEVSAGEPVETKAPTLKIGSHTKAAPARPGTIAAPAVTAAQSVRVGA
jgi:hypothetical protein